MTISPFQKYEHLFKVNDKSVGGSFYLQSKVSELQMGSVSFGHDVVLHVR